jgi:hypothetical protein
LPPANLRQLYNKDTPSKIFNLWHILHSPFYKLEITEAQSMKPEDDLSPEKIGPTPLYLKNSPRAKE